MVFIRKKGGKREPAFPVGVTLNRKPTAGEVGIEIEVEGKRLPRPEHLSSAWTYHQDGSLRGEENAEYVLGVPLKFDEVDGAIKDLWAIFKERKSVLDDSIRTSVHVHVNVQQFHLNRLAAFTGLYFCVEEILTQWCGDRRVGNLFCLRAKDAPAIITQLRKFIMSDMNEQIRDNFHYAGLNANAVHKFGSLEFRTLRGVTDPTIILTWVGILRRLYELSAEFPDPRAVCDMLSSAGPFAFFETVLGEYALPVRQEVSMTDDELRDSLYSGVRLAQDICYCRDWSEYNPAELKPDPFGRDAKKVAARLKAAVDPGLATSVPMGSIAVGPTTQFFAQPIDFETSDIPEWMNVND